MGCGAGEAVANRVVGKALVRQQALPGGQRGGARVTGTHAGEPIECIVAVTLVDAHCVGNPRDGDRRRAAGGAGYRDRCDSVGTIPSDVAVVAFRVAGDSAGRDFSTM